VAVDGVPLQKPAIRLGPGLIDPPNRLRRDLEAPFSEESAAGLPDSLQVFA
jgi:hypothetical protein